ncbi:MAG: ASCH domain-containing protein [Rhodobacteraceae bacterium]|nr:ASCH domain-containing protein [Paracoccaceae bacterium]
MDLTAKYPGAVTFKFGGSEWLCNDLAQRVIDGKKRATCGAMRDFQEGGEALPVEGRCDIVFWWDDTPAAVIETRRVFYRKFKDMDEDFALKEGENDDLAGWQRDHRAYFERNGGWSEDMDLVCEEFEVVEVL